MAGYSNGKRIKVDFVLEGTVMKKRTGTDRNGRAYYEVMVDVVKYDQELLVRVPEEEFDKLKVGDAFNFSGTMYTTQESSFLYCKEPKKIQNQIMKAVQQAI